MVLRAEDCRGAQGGGAFSGVCSSHATVYLLFNRHGIRLAEYACECVRVRVRVRARARVVRVCSRAVCACACACACACVHICACTCACACAYACACSCACVRMRMRVCLCACVRCAYWVYSRTFCYCSRCCLLKSCFSNIACYYFSNISCYYFSLFFCSLVFQSGAHVRTNPHALCPPSR